SAIDDRILSKPLSEVIHRTPQQPLGRRVFTVARPIGFHIKGQRQTGSHHADQGEMMTITNHLLSRVANGAAQRAAATPPPSRSGAVHGQTASAEDAASDNSRAAAASASSSAAFALLLPR